LSSQTTTVEVGNPTSTVSVTTSALG
jgi:hypothetical protein